MAIFDNDEWLDWTIERFNEEFDKQIDVIKEERNKKTRFKKAANLDVCLALLTSDTEVLENKLGIKGFGNLAQSCKNALPVTGSRVKEYIIDENIKNDEIVRNVLIRFATKCNRMGWTKYSEFLSENLGINGENAMQGESSNATDIKVTVESTMAKGYKQVIFTGAPGTGKTYSVRKYVEENVTSEDDWKFVQFHPSYDYSDFVEGLRPVTIEGSKEPTFVRMDGTFKAFCRHIVEEQNKENADKNKKYYFVVDEINRADLAKVFGELMFGLEESYRGIENRFDTQYKNLVTYVVNDEGIAAPMPTDVFEEGFYIPENLIFIGTMNDIDRSVESFDFALRRRFQWEEIKANVVMEDVLKEMLNRDDDILKNCIEKIVKMNEVLSDDSKFGLTEAYHIGPAYFKTLTGSTEDELRVSLEEIFNTNIVSIIKEYTRGRNPEDVKKLIVKCAEKLGVNYKEA